MNKKLDIILVEDDVIDCEKMASAIDAAYEDFNLVAITNSANTAIKNIRELQPDIIILDLELTFGQGNGFEVLESIKNDPLPFNPYIVITTNNISNITHSIVSLTPKVGIKKLRKTGGVKLTRSPLFFFFHFLITPFDGI